MAVRPAPSRPVSDSLGLNTRDTQSTTTNAPACPPRRPPVRAAPLHSTDSNILNIGCRSAASVRQSSLCSSNAASATAASSPNDVPVSETQNASGFLGRCKAEIRSSAVHRRSEQRGVGGGAAAAGFGGQRDGRGRGTVRNVLSLSFQYGCDI